MDVGGCGDDGYVAKRKREEKERRERRKRKGEEKEEKGKRKRERGKGKEEKGSKEVINVPCHMKPLNICPFLKTLTLALVKTSRMTCLL
jgi:hypothetical protein